MKITLLHPSRSRPEKAFSTYRHWMNLASGKPEIEHLLSLDYSDPLAGKYEYFGPNSSTILSTNDCVVQATNEAAKNATGGILIYLSDDFKCPQEWDLKIIDAVNKHYSGDDGLWLLKVDDCLQKFHVPVLTIPIMSRELYQRLGWFWHPEYKSMFCDEHLYWVCKNNGWLVEAPELQFPHEHCTIGKAVRDETYIRSEANWNQGKALFAKHKAEGFPV